MPDHIHIFITRPPFDAPSKIAKLLKGRSARKLFIRHPELKRSVWGDTCGQRVIIVELRGTYRRISFDNILRIKKQRVASHPPTKLGGFHACIIYENYYNLYLF